MQKALLLHTFTSLRNEKRRKEKLTMSRDNNVVTIYLLHRFGYLTIFVFPSYCS